MMASTSTRRLPGEFIKSTVVSGVLVILPLGLAAIVLLKIVDMMRPLATILVEWMPHGLRFPTLIALLLLLVVLLASGLLAQTRAGRGAGTSLEGAILNRIPGYSMVRSLTRRIGNVEESEKFAPAFVEIEDALVPLSSSKRMRTGATPCLYLLHQPPQSAGENGVWLRWRWTCQGRERQPFLRRQEGG